MNENFETAAAGGGPNLVRARRRQTGSALPTDRLPPHSAEAEAGALACVLFAPETALEALNTLEERGVSGEWFYELRHQALYAAMLALHRAGQAVDFLTLSQWLKDRGQLEDAGGPAYLTDLPDQVPSPANLGYYLDILHDQLLLRGLVRAAGEITGSVYSVQDGEKTEPEQLLARVERDLLRLQEEQLGEGETRIRALAQEVLDELEDYHRGRPQLRGLTTGLEYVDKLLCGVGGRNGNYFVVSARPGVGKTSWATQLAIHVAKDYAWFQEVLENGQPVMVRDGELERFKTERKVGQPVGIFTLEMEKHALVQRMIFQRAQADLQRWRTGYAVGEDVPRLAQGAQELMLPDNIFIDDTGRCTIDTLKAKARRMARQHGIKLFIIDYIQLLRCPGRRYRVDRVQELSDISGEIQALGKELQVPFVVLAQMNRDYEKEPNRQPRLSDLKDCGSIEQDADVVAFLYSPKLKEKKLQQYQQACDAEFGQDWSKYPQRVNLLVAKNRYGPTGVCELLFQKAFTLFRDYQQWLRQREDLPAREEVSEPEPTTAPTDEQE